MLRNSQNRPGPRRDATSASVAAPWYANQSIPAFTYQVGNQQITIQGPIALGPETVGTDPVGIADDPLSIFVETVPINEEPVCPCANLESIQARGTIDTWLVVTPTGKGQNLSDLAFLKHIETDFDLKAEQPSGMWAVAAAPSIRAENGQGSQSPVLTGPLANEDLKKESVTRGAACPVTIPSVPCPIQSPKGPPAR